MKATRDQHRDIRAAIAAEYSSITQLAETWGDGACVVLMDAIRLLDSRAVQRAAIGLDATTSTAQDDTLLRLGFNPALKMLLDRISEGIGIPVRHATHESLHHAGTLLNHLGRLRSIERHLQLVEHGVYRLDRSKSLLRFVPVAADASAEIMEHIDLSWLRRQRPELKIDVPGEIRAKMHELVYLWRDHLIGYDTTPELDFHFARQAFAIFEEQKNEGSIHPHFKFEGFTAREVFFVAAALASFYLKHLCFALEFADKFPQALLPNATTIWTETGDLSASVLEFGKAIAAEAPPSERHLLRLTGKVVHRCLDALTIDKNNASHHCSKFYMPMPSLIRVRRNYWIRPLSSLLEGPLAFGTRELRRKYSRQWDKNQRRREAWFRSDLYALFQGTRYACLHLPAPLHDDGKTLTDVDAAIFDLNTRQAGIFQLKWQEDFGLEERERVRRAAKLQKEITSWTDKLVGLIKRKGLTSIISQLGLPHDTASVHLFAIARPQARFSGIEIANADCAVASWNQFVRARFELGPSERTFEALQHHFRAELDRRPNVELDWMEFNVAGFDVEALSLVKMPDPQNYSAERPANS